MLEPQYLGIYTCCDKVEPGRGLNFDAQLIFLLSSLSHLAATIQRTLQDKRVGKVNALELRN